jgi:hypothetical protein
MSKYNIRISGYGSEVTIGHVTPEIKKQIEELYDEDETITSIFVNNDYFGYSWSEFDDFFHNFNANENFNLTIHKDDEIIYELTSDELRTKDEYEGVITHKEFSDEYNITRINDDLAVYCVTGEKGGLFYHELETDDFDIKKLNIIMLYDVGNDFYNHGEMVYQIFYDDELLDNEGGDTDGKSFDIYMNI